MSIKRQLVVAVLGIALAGVSASAIDVWDQSTEDDNTIGTDNGLTHGTEQTHDLGAEAGVADQDWYIFSNAGRSSYEVLIDGTTGDMNLNGGDVARMTGAATVAQNSVQLAGYSAALRWQNTNAVADTEWIRVSGAACGTACSSNDQYRIRFFDTTYSIPRFNNSATQVTVFQVASLAPFACSATFYFYNTAGTFLGSTTNSYSAREIAVINTSALGFAAGQSGSAVISHTCGYGNLAGKSTALEPATGFTFDTPIFARLR